MRLQHYCIIFYQLTDSSCIFRDARNVTLLVFSKFMFSEDKSCLRSDLYAETGDLWVCLLGNYLEKEYPGKPRKGFWVVGVGGGFGCE